MIATEVCEKITQTDLVNGTGWNVEIRALQSTVFVKVSHTVTEKFVKAKFNIISKDQSLDQAIKEWISIKENLEIWPVIFINMLN